MDINQQKKYVFKEAYQTEDGTIPEGTEIIVFRGLVYINGGMADAYSRRIILNIISNNNDFKKYLTQVQLINNKI